ncbi:unnamed protein product, partial [Ixodes pacificus]
MLAGRERPLRKRSTMILSFIGCCLRTAADSTRTVAVPLPSIPQLLLLKYPGAGAVVNEESAQEAAGDSFVPGHEGPTAVPESTGDALTCSPQGLPGVNQTSPEAQVERPLAAFPKSPAPRKASRNRPYSSSSRVACLTSSPTEPNTKQEMGKNIVVASGHSCLNFSHRFFFFSLPTVKFQESAYATTSAHPHFLQHLPNTLRTFLYSVK